jgi:hypothetical protein
MKSMRYMPVVWTLLFALCHTAAAETQTVKISGSVDALYIYKENFDLRGGNDAAMVPLTDTVPGAPGTGASVTDSSDSADWFMSTLRVGIAAELSDNVSVVIGLFNQRDWNSNVFSGGTGGTSTGNSAEEFDLGVDMAYVTLKEAFYTPLTLILGRQEIEFGRGLMIGSPWDLDPQSTIAADEFTATYAFDAARAVLDFEPWTLDFVWANYAQGDANDRDSHSFLWINTHYQFSEYSAVWEGYFGADLDGNTADNTAALSDSVRANDNTSGGTSPIQTRPRNLGWTGRRGSLIFLVNTAGRSTRTSLISAWSIFTGPGMTLPRREHMRGGIRSSAVPLTA